MVKFYNHIPSDLQEWALKQSIFFVASNPLTGSHINCSPKGRPSATLTILNENLVGYMDASGSGVETISHVYENGRVTLMFCSFDRSPRIMRWFCRGRVVETGHAEYAMWVKRMGKAEYPGMRAVVILDVFKVQTSCGFAVPLLSGIVDSDQGSRARFEERKTLDGWAKKTITVAGGMEDYRAKMNTRSLDGLPGLRSAMERNGENAKVQEMLWWFRRTISQWQPMLLGALMTLVAVALLRVFVVGSSRWTAFSIV